MKKGVGICENPLYYVSILVDRISRCDTRSGRPSDGVANGWNLSDQQSHLVFSSNLEEKCFLV